MAKLKDTRIYGSLVVDNGLLVSGVTTNVAGVTTYPGGIVVSGISTLSTTLIGTGTSTGTSSQPLQVSGGAYVSGSVGVGTTIAGSGIKLDVVGGEIRAGRVDTGNEGGQVSFSRSTDNATAWYIDVYGSTSTPQLRFVDVSTSAVRGGITSTGNFQFDSGYGSAVTAYGCRAWVCFNGNGSTSANQTIRASGNVSTVFKNATGDYTVNFTTAMPDANYSFAAAASGSGSDGYAGGRGGVDQTSSSVRIAVWSYPVLGDSPYVSCTVFR